MLSRIQTRGIGRLTAILACAALSIGIMCAGEVSAHKQRRRKGHAVGARSRHNKTRRATGNNNTKASETVNSNPVVSDTAAPGGNIAATPEPFAAIAREVASGNGTALRFKGTDLDKQARGTAQVALRGLTLFVRVRMANLPSPATFNQQHYLLWVDLPNYGQKLLLGDLPLAGTRRKKGRGKSDTAYFYAALPEGAVFGGLMLTAEPKRFLPTPSEPLHLLLVALPAKQNSSKLIATSTPAAPNATTPSASKKAEKEQGKASPAPQH